MAVVSTTSSFSNNEQITSIKLNNIMVNSAFVSNAVVSNQGLEVTAGGQMQIPNGGIKTALLETGAIDASKISTGGPSWTASSVSLPSNTSVSGTVTATGFVGPLTGNVTGNVTGSTVTSGTAVAASGSSVTFGSIPSWVTKVTLLFNNLSTNGTTVVQVRAGTGGTLSSTNYFAFQARISGSATCDLSPSTTGVEVFGSAASSVRFGSITFIRLGSSNTWIIEGMSSTATTSDSSRCCFHTGNVALSGELDIIGITCGTNTFDTGTLNVIYQ
jgi:hypothetical protein